MTATPEGADSGDNGNGRVTRAWISGEIALLTSKIDNLTAVMNECKIGLNQTVTKIHQQDIEMTGIKKDVAPLVEIQSAFRKQIIAWVFGAVSLSSIFTYVISNLTK